MAGAWAGRPGWGVAAALAALALGAVRWRGVALADGRQLCPACGYDKSRLPADVCPECGLEHCWPPAAVGRRRLERVLDALAQRDARPAR